MSVVLFLNDTQLYPDSAQSIKLTRENPYFTESESYTLDVVLPTDILENRQFFGNIQRMECSKQPPSYKCRLLVDNHVVLAGSARITQVTQKQIKVQLAGGSSEANISGAKVYIDEMNMGTKTLASIQPAGYDNYNNAGVRFVCLQAYDETAAELVNQKTAFMRANEQGTIRTPLTGPLEGDAPQPALLDVLAKVIEQLGYTPGTIYPWREPWHRIYVASAKKTSLLAHALPHWTAKEFLSQICSFFNCTMRVDSQAGTISFVSNMDFYGNATTVRLEPVDEYNVEVNTDDKDAEAQSLANANLAFSLSASASHDYDCLTEAVRNSVPRLTAVTETMARAAWQAMDPDIRRKYIFGCPTGCFVDWKDGEDSLSRLVAVDMLGPLVRSGNEDESVRELKIVPVAITDAQSGLYIEDVNGIVRSYAIAFRSMSLENPTGHELVGENNIEAQDVQALITGESSVESTAEKEDLLQVFLLEDVQQPAVATLEYEDDETEFRTFMAIMPMTAYDYKVLSADGQQHRRWSLSLKPSGADHYLGQLHQNSFSFNMKAKYCFRFPADNIPDPTQVFYIKGKRYGCEKIEANIAANGFDRLMTGYFYEMQS